MNPITAQDIPEAGKYASLTGRVMSPCSASTGVSTVAGVPAYETVGKLFSRSAQPVKPEVTCYS